MVATQQYLRHCALGTPNNYNLWFCVLRVIIFDLAISIVHEPVH
jgi:hypothetical protein